MPIVRPQHGMKQGNGSGESRGDRSILPINHARRKLLCISAAPKTLRNVFSLPPQIFLYRVTMLTSTSLSLPTTVTIVTSTSCKMAHHVNAVETLTTHLCFWLQDGAQGASAAEYPPDSDLHALFRFPLLLGKLKFTCKLSVGRLGVASATSANISGHAAPAHTISSS